MHPRPAGYAEAPAELTPVYAVAATPAERRASRFTAPPTAPAARTTTLSAGAQMWSMPSTASSENGPYPVNASATAPVAYSSGTSMPFVPAKSPFFQCTLPAAIS